MGAKGVPSTGALCSAARVLSISKHRGLGISHSPASRLCAPRAKPLSQPPPPRALRRTGESGGDPKSLPALPQGGKPPAHRCHRPRVAGREPLLRDREKLWRVLAASRDVGRGGRPSSFPSQPSSGPPFAAGRNVQPVPSTNSSSSPRSWHQANPPFPLPSLSGMSPAVVLGEKGIWGCKRGVMGSWVGAGTMGHRYGGKFGVLCPCPQSHSRNVFDPGAQTAR